MRLSWPGASGKPSLTLSLTPRPASTQNPASPGLPHRAAHQLGSQLCSKRPAPRGVGRPSGPGQSSPGRRESGTRKGEGGGQVHKPDVPAHCHPSCHVSHPSQPHSRPSRTDSLPSIRGRGGGALQLPDPGAGCPSPTGVRGGTAQYRSLGLRATWGIWGQSQAPPSSPSFHPTPSPISSGRPQTLVGRGGGKGSSPGAWFSFSCPESEPLWETSEGY